MIRLAGFIILGLIVTAIVAALAYRAWRQHKNVQLLTLDTPNRIHEEMFVKIGGIEQWLQIRGADRDNPVLLFMHGGPGFSYIPFTPIFREWEKHFTVVQWDQRGTGKTYGRADDDKTGLTIDRMTQDGIEVSEFLLTHLNKRKLVLFAHSWGTIPGYRMASQRPDLFYAYVGTGQIVDMPRNEFASYELLRERLQNLNDGDSLKELEAIGPPPYKDVKTWMVKGRLLVKKSPPPATGSLPNIFSLALFAPNYSLKDAYHLFAAFNYSLSSLYPEMMAYDARKLGNKMNVPVFVWHGEADLQAAPLLAVEFVSNLEAPKKEFVLLKGENHTAVLSNPDLFLERLLRDVRPLTAP